MTNGEIMKKLKNTKKTKKTDIGYGTKKLALDDMKKDNTMFDDLDGYYGNSTDELDKIFIELAKK